MKAPVRVGLFGVGLLAVFAASFTLAGAVVPADAPAGWNSQMESQMEGSEMNSPTHDGDEAAPTTVPGLAVAHDGYQLREVTSPNSPGQQGTLTLHLTGPDGRGVSRYVTSHDKDLHLIVVRADGAHFRHVHPTHRGDGRWSMPWTWAAAGSYRIFADFVPADRGEGLTLTSTVSVAGDFAPEPGPRDSTSTTSGEYTVELTGALRSGTYSDLRFTVTRGGRQVATLEPYLGAFGHLVALREGDLGYLHVHPVGAPGDGATQPGPEIAFRVAAPTDGRYLLYLDFAVDGRVHNAKFVVTAAPAHPGAGDQMTAPARTTAPAHTTELDHLPTPSGSAQLVH